MITETQILEAIRTALEAPSEDAFTVGELAEKLEISRPRVREAIRQMIKSGQAEHVTVRRLSIDGRFLQNPGYRIKPKEE